MQDLAICRLVLLEALPIDSGDKATERKTVQLLAHNTESKRFQIHELFMVCGKTSLSLHLMKFIILKFKQNFLLEGTMHFFFFIFKHDKLSFLNFSVHSTRVNGS
jgi:hypothetical protein